jgi:hypothetical protein
MDDPLLAIAAVFPLALAGVGLGFTWYSWRTPTPADVESDVLAALSVSEALPIALICRRPPLAGTRVHPDVVRFTLEHLRRSGRAVRWYAGDLDQTREAVYRRVA